MDSAYARVFAYGTAEDVRKDCRKSKNAPFRPDFRTLLISRKSGRGRRLQIRIPRIKIRKSTSYRDRLSLFVIALHYAIPADLVSAGATSPGDVALIFYWSVSLPACVPAYHRHTFTIPTTQRVVDFNFGTPVYTSSHVINVITRHQKSRNFP